MGIVARQSIKNFFWSNIGVLLGAIYTFLIIPRVFDENPEQWGMIQLIIYYSQILLPISLVSIPTLIIRYFPGFKKEQKEGQLFSGSLTIVIAMVLLVSVAFVLFRGFLLSDQDGAEIQHYILLVIPTLFLSSIFEVYTAWSKANLRSTVPNFLKDSFLKIWNFLMILLFYFQVISFDSLILLYFVSYFFQVLILFFYIRSKQKISFKVERGLFKSTFKKEHLSYMFFTVMGTAAFTLMNKLDVVMIGKMLSLQEVAFYSIGLALVAFVQLPEKSISAIAVPTLSHLIEEGNSEEIKTLYRKTSINQLVISGFIFIGIWINMENISTYLGPKFGNIEYVILFLGLAKLMDVFTGLNGPLIGISKYYRAALWMQIVLVIIVVTSNLVFIPCYGINGAAFASFISLTIYNIIKTLYVYTKYRMWPFTFRSFLAIAIGLLTIFLNTRIPRQENLYVDVLLRSIIFVALYGSLVLSMKVSEDINQLIAGPWNRLRKNRKK